MTRSRAITISISAVAVFATLALPGVASAADFQGSCAATGRGTFVQPAGFLPRLNIGFLLEGTGTCSGKLDSRPVADYPVSVVQDATYAVGGCAPVGVADGRTTLRFGPPPPTGTDYRPSLVLRTTYLGSPAFLVEGVRSGLGTGFLTAFTQPQPPGVVEGCLAGSAARFAWELRLQTLTELQG